MSKLKLLGLAAFSAIVALGITMVMPVQTRTQPASASQTSKPLAQPAITETPVTSIVQDTSESPFNATPAPEKVLLTPAPATTTAPDNGICQYPYYQVSAGPNEPTICALHDGYTDCHNGTAVPDGKECDPATAPKPYVEPEVR